MKKIYISSPDHKTLIKIIRGQQLPNGKLPDHLAKLQQELERAQILAPEEMPPRTVGLNAAVTIRDLESDETEEWILTMPAHADPEQRRLSVLAPIGTAILGFREGDEVEWTTPGGTRILKLETVEPGIFTAPDMFDVLYS